MTSTFTDTGREAAIHDYVQRCRPYLLDLTPDQQDQLEDDIRQIVGEVAMELNGQPDDLVGPPLRFVAELRTAAGLPLQLLSHCPQAPEPARTLATAGSAIKGLSRWIRRTATPWVVALAKDLRPAGWVLRGVGLAILAGALTQDYGHQGIVPNLFRSQVLGIAVTIGAVVASVEIGQKHLTGRGQRLAVAVASVAAAIGLVVAAGDITDPYNPNFDPNVTDEAFTYDDSQMTTATTVLAQLENGGSAIGIAPFLNEPTRSTITFLTDTDAPMTDPIASSTQAHEVLNQIRNQGFLIGSVSLAVQSHHTDVAEPDSGHGKYIFETFDDAHQFVEDFFATR